MPELNGAVHVTSTIPVTVPTPDLISLQAQLNAARAENARLKSRKPVIKLTEKGDISMYLMGSPWPVTISMEKVRLMLPYVPELKTFVEENRVESERRQALNKKK
jgi:hypothetical protein